MKVKLLALLLCLFAFSSLAEDVPAADAAPADAPPSLRLENDADLENGVYDAFFDDALFVGDSVTRQLSRYIKECREKKENVLSDAKFLVAGNYRLSTAALKGLGGSVRMTYQGREITIPNAVHEIGRKYVFVLLGLNDHVGSNMEGDVRRYRAMMNHILDKNPGVTLVCESMSPIQEHRQSKTLNKKNLDAFNVEIEKLCGELGAVYLDIATPLMNEDGFLTAAYALSKNDNVHLNEKGLRVWIDTLRRYARDCYERGLWTPQP